MACLAAGQAITWALCSLFMVFFIVSDCVGLCYFCQHKSTDSSILDLPRNRVPGSNLGFFICLFFSPIGMTLRHCHDICSSCRWPLPWQMARHFLFEISHTFAMDASVWDSCKSIFSFTVFRHINLLVPTSGLTVLGSRSFLYVD